VGGGDDAVKKRVTSEKVRLRGPEKPERCKKGGGFRRYGGGQTHTGCVKENKGSSREGQGSEKRARIGAPCRGPGGTVANGRSSRREGGKTVGRTLRGRNELGPEAIEEFQKNGRNAKFRVRLSSKTIEKTHIRKNMKGHYSKTRGFGRIRSLQVSEEKWQLRLPKPVKEDITARDRGPATKVGTGGKRGEKPRRV